MRITGLVVVTLSLALFACSRQNPKVLVFSKTTGYRHQSIGAGKLALIKLGKENGFDVDTTENANAFREDNLKQYSAVIFLSTTLDVLDKYQQSEFKRFIEAGGGYVGIHAAADTEYEWPWYGKLVGAWFKSHPKIQEATLKKQSALNNDDLPETWTRTDEWYNYKKISDDIKVLYTLDEASYEGGENGDFHPIAWYHDYEGGRSFYTGLGHTEESYSDSLFLKHLLQGIKYAMGNNSLDYSKATTKHAVEDNRFSKVVLDFNLNEPTEMTVLPDSKIIFLERKGDVKMYNPQSGDVNVINTFKVNTKFEDGMIGLTLDPGFKDNHWLYVYYSHPERSANVLSRFTFTGDSIDTSSEKELLEVKTQREQCCHTGGSLLFGPDGNLYISTGDNTSPFESNGFSPSDERPGRSPFDAQKSSANTNDLRGKILRIHPERDGTYTIPEGNLFPKGEADTRPEIYVMGCRNPYRISIDERTGYLYWGEVGPDARADDPERGPRGYDEVNQAKEAGFFGWPYFVGDNYAYAKYDFATGTSNGFRDPAKPENHSPNNTGKTELPPAHPAYIWYPYVKSPDFPMVKEGGRNAMAGPVYYSKNYQGVSTAFPDYLDGKLLIYDWMRNWIFLVTMDEEGKIKDIEPFMENTSFNNMMDMAYGPDGKLYMVEYGTVWFSQNLDARLVRIDYNGGNRPPVAMLNADKTSGKLPMTVQLTTAGTVDYDGDKLDYVLDLNGDKKTSTDGMFTVTFDKPGVYQPILKVTDSKGNADSAQVQIIAGNEPPAVKVSVEKGNTTFFFPGTPVAYNVEVDDHEDGSTGNGKISPDDVTVTFDYIKGYDMTQLAQGHQHPPVELPGKALMDQSDCKSCHLAYQESAGPAYSMIAKKYSSVQGASDKLAAKVIKGGGGVWGDREMAAHPQVTVDDAKKMVEYILSLSGESQTKKLPLHGTVKPDAEQDGVYVLKASYTDKPVNNLPSLSGTSSHVLRAPVLNLDQASRVEGATKRSTRDGRTYLDQIRNGSYVVFSNIDLTGVKQLMPLLAKYRGAGAGGIVEIRLDSVSGKQIASLDYAKAKKRMEGGGNVEITSEKIKVEPVDSVHDIYVVFKNENAGDKPLFVFNQIMVNPQ